MENQNSIGRSKDIYIYCVIREAVERDKSLQLHFQWINIAKSGKGSLGLRQLYTVRFSFMEAFLNSVFYYWSYSFMSTVYIRGLRMLQRLGFVQDFCKKMQLNISVCVHLPFCIGQSPHERALSDLNHTSPQQLLFNGS